MPTLQPTNHGRSKNVGLGRHDSLMTPSLPVDFARLYKESDDPWRISSGWYGRRKRALLMVASLPCERFPVGLRTWL